MIAAIGPLLGEGHVGLSEVRGQPVGQWSYLDGMAMLDSTVLAHTRNPIPTIPPEAAAVAALIGRDTGSSGEAIAVALRGRARTRFFGEATGGATSSPMSITLSDGVQIQFAGGFFVDREGTVYRRGLDPDVAVDGRWWESPDAVLDAAVRWLAVEMQCFGESR